MASMNSRRWLTLKGEDDDVYALEVELHDRLAKRRVRPFELALDDLREAEVVYEQVKRRCSEEGLAISLGSPRKNLWRTAGHPLKDAGSARTRVPRWLGTADTPRPPPPPRSFLGEAVEGGGTTRHCARRASLLGRGLDGAAVVRPAGPTPPPRMFGGICCRRIGCGLGPATGLSIKTSLRTDGHRRDLTVSS